jgi:hypothetical protein|tara:strand:- start:213 stop:413 length:201 start_codon:yes stop_codon:yes gene_type:complete
MHGLCRAQQDLDGVTYLEVVKKKGSGSFQSEHVWWKTENDNGKRKTIIISRTEDISSLHAELSAIW